MLVFGMTSAIQIVNKAYPDQRKRMISLRTDRSEMMKVIARQQLATALQFNVLTEAERDIAIGSEVTL